MRYSPIRPWDRTLPCEVVRWHSADTGVCMCQLSRDWTLSLSTDWRWDLEEKLLLLCLLYGSFFTLNAENLFRGHTISASLHRPELIFAAPGIDKAFSGAKYAGYVLLRSSLYFRVYWDLFSCYLLGFWKCHCRTSNAAILSLCPYLCSCSNSALPEQVINPLLLWHSYCLSVHNYSDYSFPSPRRLHAALNRLHFTNGKLSSCRGSRVYKYVKYTFNYFKWIWQLINKVERDKHTFDTGHCKAAGKR